MTISDLPPAPQTTDPATFDVRADALLAALPTFINEVNATAAAMNFNDSNGTSSTSTLISVASKTFTASTGKSWQLGMTLRIASTASPTNFMTGEVTAYNSSTGSLTVNVTNISGSGTLAAWTISQAGVMLQSPVLDLTGYSGADVVLGVGQLAVYTVSAVTTHLLRIATGDNQLYKLRVLPTNVASSTFANPTNLQPNNANTAAGAVTRIASVVIQGASPIATGTFVAENNFVLDSANTLYKLSVEICTRTNGKTIEANAQNTSATANAVTTTHGRWSNTTTTWSSLGTLNFGAALTGLISVKREM